MKIEMRQNDKSQMRRIMAAHAERTRAAFQEAIEASVAATREGPCAEGESRVHLRPSEKAGAVEIVVVDCEGKAEAFEVAGLKLRAWNVRIAEALRSAAK